MDGCNEGVCMNSLAIVTAAVGGGIGAQLQALANQSSVNVPM